MISFLRKNLEKSIWKLILLLQELEQQLCLNSIILEFIVLSSHLKAQQEATKKKMLSFSKKIFEVIFWMKKKISAMLC